MAKFEAAVVDYDAVVAVTAFSVCHLEKCMPMMRLHQGARRERFTYFPASRVVIEEQCLATFLFIFAYIFTLFFFHLSPPFLHQLRLLYEGNPMAYIIEKAGGLASTGKMAILDVQPQQIHERVPVFMGSSEDVQELLAFHQQN